MSEYQRTHNKYIKNKNEIILFFQEIEAHFSKKSKTNLLRKSKSEPADEKKPKDIALDNLNNLHIPIGPYVEANIIRLQQSDVLPQQQVNSSPLQGHSNPAFEESNTTHL